MDPPAFYLMSKIAAVLQVAILVSDRGSIPFFCTTTLMSGASFLWFWFSLVFDWALFRTTNVDQRNGKTESERDQRLLEMTI